MNKLRKNKDLSVCKYDKGNGVVLLDSSDYYSKLSAELSKSMLGSAYHRDNRTERKAIFVDFTSTVQLSRLTTRRGNLLQNLRSDKLFDMFV